MHFKGRLCFLTINSWYSDALTVRTHYDFLLNKYLVRFEAFKFRVYLQFGLAGIVI